VTAELAGKLRRWVVLATILFAPLACTVRPEPVPKFRIVAQQGMIRSIVVDEKVATDEAALFKIAESLLPTMPNRAVMLHVWTDARQVPERIENMTDAQQAARRAIVTINLNTGHRQVNHLP
jgi:hypothetical protein